MAALGIAALVAASAARQPSISTRSNLLQLPVTVVEQIVAEVGLGPRPSGSTSRYAELLNAACVCRAFYTIAIPQLYLRVSLHSDGLGRVRFALPADRVRRTTIPDGLVLHWNAQWLSLNGDYIEPLDGERSNKFMAAVRQHPNVGTFCDEVALHDLGPEEMKSWFFSGELGTVDEPVPPPLFRDVSKLHLCNSFFDTRYDNTESYCDDFWRKFARAAPAMTKLEHLEVSADDRRTQSRTEILSFALAVGSLSALKYLAVGGLGPANEDDYPGWESRKWLPESEAGKANIRTLVLRYYDFYDNEEEEQCLKHVEDLFRWPANLEHLVLLDSDFCGQAPMGGLTNDAWVPLLALHASTLTRIEIGTSIRPHNFDFTTFPALEYLQLHSSAPATYPILGPCKLLAPNLKTIALDFYGRGRYELWQKLNHWHVMWMEALVGQARDRPDHPLETFVLRNFQPEFERREAWSPTGEKLGFFKPGCWLEQNQALLMSLQGCLDPYYLRLVVKGVPSDVIDKSLYYKNDLEENWSDEDSDMEIDGFSEAPSEEGLEMGVAGHWLDSDVSGVEDASEEAEEEVWSGGLEEASE